MSKMEIFICHANEDKPRALEIFQFLKSKGFQPWLDNQSLLPGEDWELKTKKKLREADFVLILFSKNSVSKKGFVQKEFKIALETQKEFKEGRHYIVPVRIDDCEVPKQFRQYHHCDVFLPAHLEQLAQFILKLSTKKRKRIFVAIIVALPVLLIIFSIWPLRKRGFKNREVITVGCVIDNTGYLQWLKDSFEKKYPQYRIEYIMPGANRITKDIFLELDKNKDVQLFLGGSSQYHEERKDKLGRIDAIIEKNKDNIEYFDSSAKWIGYYQKLLGVVWNREKLPPGLIIKSINQLKKSSGSDTVLIPDPSASAASDLFYTLGMDHGQFDPNIATARYKRLLDTFNTLETNGVQSVKAVSKSFASMAVEWPQDAILIKDSFDLSCIGISIFEESLPSISCISVIKGNEGNPAVIDFVNFAVSITSQKEIFARAFKFPINRALLMQDLSALKKSGKLMYFPEQIAYLIPRRNDVTKYLKLLSIKNRVDLPYKEINRMEHTGCE